MPPKKKGSSKKPPKVKTPPLIDGLTKDEMSKEQLEEHIVRLREELDREREERNYFQLERDKIHTFGEIKERQVEVAVAEQRNLEKEIEEDERQHQVEIKVNKQKMKHLLCEHQNTTSELKADALVSTDAVHADQERVEAELHEAMNDVMVDTQELDITDLVKELQLKHDEEMNQTKSRCEKKLKDAEAKYDKNTELHLQELDNLRKKEVTERQDHWNRYSSNLAEDHREAVGKMNSLINTLVVDVTIKTEKGEMKDEIKVREKDLLRVPQDNKHLNELLSKANEEETSIKKEMVFPVKKNDSEKLRLKELSELKEDHEELKQIFSKLQTERDELYKTLTQYIRDVQQKGGLKDEQLENVLKGLTDVLEKTQAQIDSVLSASNVDQTALRGVMDQVEENLDRSKNSLEDLRRERALISKACTDLLLHNEAKQRGVGVSVQVL
ncbi:dynein regulatory complex subunit 4-like [Labrus mixtus]|uniref:dynein regulatory complex subunit 4-like n=1 Tax=Labrus mixtus TaxID=508554 RepID=UPI0029C080FE|nr:dynein regulatory complex subunit 4-like [Labrus mixtus]